MSQRTIIAGSVYLLLAVALRLSYGTYHPALIVAVTIGIAALASVLVRRRDEAEKFAAGSSDVVLSLVLLLFACLLAKDPLVILAEDGAAWLRVQWSAVALVLAAGAVYFAPRVAVLLAPLAAMRWQNAFRVAAIAVAWGAVLWARVETLTAAPRPGIDVFVTNTIACEHFLAGANPYSAEYPDVYGGKYGYAPAFFYWPAYLYFAAPAQWLGGDVRWAAIVADLLTGLALWGLARRLGLSPLSAALAPLVWLAHPVSLLVVELGWIDPVLIAAIAGSVWALAARQWLVAGALIGVAAATKQYGGLFGVLALLYVARFERERLPRMIGLAAATFFALMAPMVAWDPVAFYRSTIATYLHVPMRPDSFSLVAWMQHKFGATPPGWVTTGAALGVVAGLAGWLWRGGTVTPAAWLGAAAVAYAAIFLSGQQAFCNYFYLVAFLVLAYGLTSLAEDRRRMVVSVPLR